MKVLITHKDCVDGMACAAVFLMKHPEAKVHFCGYGDPVPADALDPANDVTIADFSFKRPTMVEQLAHAKVYDHHKTAEADLAGLPNVTFDMSECGASLLFRSLFPTHKCPPYVIDYVKDYDLWTKKLDECDEVHCYLTLIKTPEQMLNVINDASIEEIRAFGRIIRGAYRQQEERAAARAHRMYLSGGQAVNATNSPEHQSQIGNMIAEDGIPGCVWYFSNGMYNYSLRGNGSVDVSAIAARYGGGGHYSAAGFRSTSFLLND